MTIQEEVRSVDQRVDTTSSQPLDAPEDVAHRLEFYRNFDRIMRETVNSATLLLRQAAEAKILISFRQYAAFLLAKGIIGPSDAMLTLAT